MGSDEDEGKRQGSISYSLPTFAQNAKLGHPPVTGLLNVQYCSDADFPEG